MLISSLVSGYSSSDLRLEVSKRGVDKLAKDFNIPPNRSVLSFDSPKLRSTANYENQKNSPFFAFFPTSKSNNNVAGDANDPKPDDEPQISK